MGHLADCPVEVEASNNVVALYKNEETGRIVAVPGEVVHEAEREYRAYLLYTKGKTWEEVAAEEQYPDGKAAQAAVKRYLDEGKAVIGDLTRTEALAIELSILRQYRNAVHDIALEGKVPAIMAGLAIHDKITKLLGLDQPDAADEGLGDRVVVVPSNEYLDTLKKAAEADLKQVPGGN